MQYLRLVLSAVFGALLAFALFAAMGMETSPSLVRAQTLEAFPRLQVGSASTKSVSRPLQTGAQSRPKSIWISSLHDEVPSAPPRFETETRIDASHLAPQLVVMDRPISTSEVINERRWWRSLFHQLGK